MCTGVDEGERHVTPEIPKPKIQQASQSPRIPPPQALKGIPKAGKDTSAEKGCDDIKQAIKVAFKEPMKGKIWEYLTAVPNKNDDPAAHLSYKILLTQLWASVR